MWRPLIYTFQTSIPLSSPIIFTATVTSVISFILDYDKLPFDLPMSSFTYTVSDSSATVFGVSYQNLNQVAFDPTID